MTKKEYGSCLMKPRQIPKRNYPCMRLVYTINPVCLVGGLWFLYSLPLSCSPSTHVRIKSHLSKSMCVFCTIFYELWTYEFNSNVHKRTRPCHSIHTFLSDLTWIFRSAILYSKLIQIVLEYKTPLLSRLFFFVSNKTNYFASVNC